MRASNKQLNAEAVLIHRPIMTGQLRGKPNCDIDAAINGIIVALFGIDLLPPCNPNAMWQNPRTVALHNAGVIHTHLRLRH